MSAVRAMTELLPTGKLSLDQMRRLLEKCSITDPRVVVGPMVGEDAAVIDVGDRYLTLKTDPVTFVAEDVGWYVVHINANDLAVMGSVPRWFTAALLLPAGKASLADAEKVFDQLVLGCQSLGIALVGGHTEVTGCVDRPVLVGHMVGEVAKDKLVTTAGARVGDVILLTKGIAIEGTSIIAREQEGVLLRRGYDPSFIQRCKDFVFNPGISVVDEALIAVNSVRVHSMHDPTEGGIATGLHEIACAAGVGILVRQDALPLYQESETLCGEFGLDPLGTIASGALLLTVDPSDACKLLEAYREREIPCRPIGEVRPPDSGVMMETSKGTAPLPLFAADEITRLP